MCPVCSSPTRVLESRSAEGGGAVRRRRECGGCGRRFTTYERVESGPLTVQKRDGSEQRFDREKLRRSLLRATHKRDVRRDQVDVLVGRIERVAGDAGGLVSAERIGELCLAGLRELDWGAYLQFAGTLPSATPEFADSGPGGSVRPGRESSRSSTDAGLRRGFDE